MGCDHVLDVGDDQHVGELIRSFVPGEERNTSGVGLPGGDLITAAEGRHELGEVGRNGRGCGCSQEANEHGEYQQIPLLHFSASFATSTRFPNPARRAFARLASPPFPRTWPVSLSDQKTLSPLGHGCGRRLACRPRRRGRQFPFYLTWHNPDSDPTSGTSRASNSDAHTAPRNGFGHPVLGRALVRTARFLAAGRSWFWKQRRDVFGRRREATPRRGSSEGGNVFPARGGYRGGAHLPKSPELWEAGT